MLSILLAASALALPTTATQDPAGYLPADTLVYFGSHSVREGSKASRMSAMSKILGEPEVKAFLQKPLGTADQVLSQLIGMAGQMNESEMPLDMAEDFSLSGLFEPSEEGLPIGQMFFALTHVQMDGTGEAPPDVGLVVGIEMLDAGDMQQLKSLWDGIPFEAEERSHDGKPYQTKVIQAPFGVSIGFLGNMAVASLSEAALGAVMDRYYGSEASSLAGTVDYQQLLAKSGGVQAGGSSYFMRTAPMLDLCKAGLTIALVQENKLDMIPKVTGLLDGLGLTAYEWAGGVSHRDLDGYVHTTAVTRVNRNAEGLVGSILSEVEPLDLSTLESVPGDTTSVSAFSMGGLGAVYDFIMNALETLAPEEHAQANGMLTAMLGDVDLRDDIFANIDGDVWSYSLPGQAMMGQAANIFVIDMKDPQRFVSAFETLLNAGSQMMGSMGGGGSVTLEHSVHGDADFYDVDLSRTPMGAMMMMSPGLAVKDGKLWACLESSTALKSTLNGEAGEGTVMEKAGFMGFTRKLQAEGGVMTLNYVDVARSFGDVYKQAAGGIQMFAGGVSDLPVDLSLLPSEPAMSQHLGESWGGTVSSEDGLEVMRSTSQFELMDFLPLVATAGVLGAASNLGIDLGSATVEPEKSPEQIALDDISMLRAGLTVYKISEFEYPASLEDLVKPLPDYENGCLGRDEVPLDPWGSAYNFEIRGRKAVVWSSGANGINESGEGDDISKKR